ncbi:hypothetical protein GCM10027089_01650 [Nocardia thraciensis]
MTVDEAVDLANEVKARGAGGMSIWSLRKQPQPGTPSAHSLSQTIYDTLVLGDSTEPWPWATPEIERRGNLARAFPDPARHTEIGGTPDRNGGYKFARSSPRVPSSVNRSDFVLSTAANRGTRMVPGACGC